MADSEAAENRTEEPTPRRRQRARDEGQIAKSPELAAAATLLAGAVLLGSFAGRAIGRELGDLFRTAPAWLVAESPSLTGVTILLRALAARMAVALAPLWVGLALVALGVGLLQSRGSASWKPVAPDLSRIDPVAGFRRVFGGGAAFNLIKSVLKLAALGTVGYLTLRGAWSRFAELTERGPAEIGRALALSTLDLSFAVALAFLVIGGLDYVVQFIRHEKNLKMARHEVIQEYREQEGDPHLKARIRQIGRQRARQRMLAHVAKADVVITNPTHIAVALKYDAALAGAPIVVAMGERKLAERIKAIAERAGVPMVENKPLARALLATGVVGGPIPPALYVAVAEILAFVYRKAKRLPSLIGDRRVT